MPIRRSAPPRRFVRAWLTPAAVALAVAVPAGGALSAPGGVEESRAPARYQNAGYCADAEERAFLDLLNGYRAQNGLGPVRLSQMLGAAAESHSAEMANSGYFGHTMLGGVDVGENLRNNGYADGRYGENIAAGQESAEGVFSQWRNSASHNASMLSGAFEAVGIARAYDANSGYGWYWTTLYGGSLDAPAAGCGEAQPVVAAEATAEPTPQPTAEPTAIPEPTPEPTAIPEPTAEPTAVADPTIEPEATAEVPPAPTAAAVATASADAAPSTADAPVGEATEAGDPVAAAELNLRIGPGTDFPTTTTVPSGAGLTVTGPAEAGYLPVTAGGRFGWVDAEFVTYQGLAAPAEGATAAATTVAVAPDGEAAPAAGTASSTATTTDEATLRSGPSSAETVLLLVPAGASVELTGEASGGYFGVLYGDQAGWVDAAFLTS